MRLRAFHSRRPPQLPPGLPRQRRHSRPNLPRLPFQHPMSPPGGDHKTRHPKSILRTHRFIGIASPPLHTRRPRRRLPTPIAPLRRPPLSPHHPKGTQIRPPIPRSQTHHPSPLPHPRPILRHPPPLNPQHPLRRTRRHPNPMVPNRTLHRPMRRPKHPHHPDLRRWTLDVTRFHMSFFVWGDKVPPRPPKCERAMRRCRTALSHFMRW